MIFLITEKIIYITRIIVKSIITFLIPFIILASITVIIFLIRLGKHNIKICTGGIIITKQCYEHREIETHR